MSGVGDEWDFYLSMPQSMTNWLYGLGGTDPETIELLQLSWEIVMGILVLMGLAIFTFKAALPHYRSIKHSDWREGKGSGWVALIGLFFILSPIFIESISDFILLK